MRRWRDQSGGLRTPSLQSGEAGWLTFQVDVKAAPTGLQISARGFNPGFDATLKCALKRRPNHAITSITRWVRKRRWRQARTNGRR